MAPRQPIANRLLFPSLPHDAVTPPLLLSPAASTELNAELYDFIAIALRAYVVPWWSKISRYDKEFLPQFTRVLTTVVRVLEARVLAADLPFLLLHRVPILVSQHYSDYRSATAKLSTSYASGGAASLPQLFHQLQLHMAVSSDGRIDSEYLRQVVDLILNVCLPDEDYQPDAERFIIREIIIKLILNDIVPKITQPWFIEQTILQLLQNTHQVPFTT
jgi:PXA domain